MTGKKIDEKTRQDAIRAYENGVTRKKIAERFGISLSSVGRIVTEKVPKSKQEKKAGYDVTIERQKRIGDLERRIAELEKKILELEAGKKLNRSIPLTKSI